MSERWDFYFCRLEDAPAAVVVNLGVADEAPVAGLGELICVRIPLSSPSEAGLLAPGESEALTALEDTLRSALENAGTAPRPRMVGRLTWSGVREFFFYAADASGLEAAAHSVLATHPGYRVLSRHEPDPEWKTYSQFLYPSQREWQWIRDRHVVDTLAARGDRSQEPRPVDHFAYFASQAHRDAFLEAARSRGFSAEPHEDARKPGAHLVRNDPVELAHIHEVTLELLDLAAQYGGDYDGWGCPIVSR